ncbi:MAG TPA: methylenetetrahydrofolate--tRNA-(uracil(54)-C(5))-methyltransferase (FADH(2)-oxidizing) TrmFO [Candidatus Binataceae bacterium]|nr:methylenetetrahydrofolate--tRNA-(uracil(54)-C(5))-methyltransferase (FADH(2)-oxidizing) TrmFO [Candidatus Binataceae bacterium]
MKQTAVNVVGAGLAGSEAAFQLARRGVKVRLHEMRPKRTTEAHQTAMFAELVCSNSLRNDSMETAVGVLKHEMRRLGSLVIAAADRARVPAGSALAVDRVRFAEDITAALENHPMIEVVREEVTAIPPGPTILASGPLTSAALGAEFSRIIGPQRLYFYDAISPIVTADSINMEKAFRAARYGKGGDDYLNCPMTETEYEAFVEALLAAEKVPTHPFERPVYFEGCMPIEEMARRGPKTLAFGPMRPVGLTDPRTAARPAAVVQLRQDDSGGRLYNIVGFQTKMTYPEQRRVLRMIPGLERAEFVRLGSLHRNTFIDSPRLLTPALQLKSRSDLFVAGQMIGVEGYVESAAAGLLAAINVARMIEGRELVIPPIETAMGSLIGYITDPNRKDFQPMNANYGLMPELHGLSPRRGSAADRGRQKKLAMGTRAIAAFDDWIARHDIDTPDSDGGKSELASEASTPPAAVPNG